MRIATIAGNSSHPIGHEPVEPVRGSRSNCIAVVANVPGTQNKEASRLHYAEYLGYNYFRSSQMLDHPVAHDQIEAVIPEWQALSKTGHAMVYLRVPPDV